MEYEKDIRVRTKKFAVRIIKLVLELKVRGIEYSLRDQILRSGTSVEQMLGKEKRVVQKRS